MYLSGDAARKKYDYLLDELPHRPSHDLASWNYYKGDYIRSMIESYKGAIWWPEGALQKKDYHIVLHAIFTKRYYGGEAAMVKQEKFNKMRGGSGGDGTDLEHYAGLQKAEIQKRLKARLHY